MKPNPTLLVNSRHSQKSFSLKHNRLVKYVFRRKPEASLNNSFYLDLILKCCMIATLSNQVFFKNYAHAMVSNTYVDIKKRFIQQILSFSKCEVYLNLFGFSTNLLTQSRMNTSLAQRMLRSKIRGMQTPKSKALFLPPSHPAPLLS